MPKAKDKPAAKDQVLELLKGSRDPLLIGEIASKTGLSTKATAQVLNRLRAAGEAHVAAYLDGNKHKSQWALGKGKGAKKRKAKARTAAAPAAAAVTGVCTWVSSLGTVRIEKGEQTLDLDNDEAVELLEFLTEAALADRKAAKRA